MSQGLLTRAPARTGAVARSRGADLVVVAALALAAGAAPALGLSPLLLPAGLAALAVVVRLLRAPDTALAIALVVVLLPPGLLPRLLQSALDAASVLVAASAALLAARHQRRVEPMPFAVWAMAAFVVWAMIALLWSAHPGLGSDLIRRYTIALLLLAVVISRTNGRAGVERILGALAVVGLIVTLSSVYALATASASGGRLQVFDMNANQVGNVLLLATPGVLWRSLAPGRGTRWRAVQSALFLVAVLVIIGQSGSRGSLLAFVAVLAAFLAARSLRRWGLVAGALCTALLLAAPATLGTVLDRFQADDPDELTRTTLWSAGLTLVAEHPFGVGTGEGPYALPAHIDALESQDRLGGRETMPAHNPLLEVGADTGIVGLVLFGTTLVVAGGSFARSMRRAQRRGDVYWTRYGALVGAGSAGFLLVWWKSGGESYSFTTFVLLALWLGGTRAYQREQRLAARRR